MILKELYPESTGYLSEYLYRTMPQIFESLPHSFIENFLTADIPTLSFAVVGMLWSASKGIKSLSAGLCAVYGGNSKKGWVRKYFYSFCYTLCFLVFSALWLAASFLGESVLGRLEQGEVLLFWLRFKGVISFVVVTLLVSLVYKLLGASEYSLCSLIPGALFFGVGYSVYSKLFSLYINYFSNHSILYGSMGLVPVVMLWVYSLVTILLLGAEVNLYILQHKYGGRCF